MKHITKIIPASLAAAALLLLGCNVHAFSSIRVHTRSSILIHTDAAAARANRLNRSFAKRKHSLTSSLPDLNLHLHESIKNVNNICHRSTHLLALLSEENDDSTEELGSALASVSPLLEDSDDERSSAGSNDGSTSSGSDDEAESTGKAILSLAVPALAGLAIDPLMTLVDTVFVGRTATNADALAGIGSAAALLTFSFYLFNFLCTVTTPLVSQRRASGDEDGAITVGGQALSLALILGTILSTVLVIFSQPLLRVMGTDNTGVDANAYATSFLTLRAIAAPAVFLTSAGTGILRGYLDTRTTFYILLGANAVNLMLDVVLISWLGLGPTGAAIATTSAEWITALSLLGILSGNLPSADRRLGSNQLREEAVDVDGVDGSPNANVNGDAAGGEYTNVDENMNGSGSDMVVITPTLQVPTWESIKPLVVASSSVFVRSFMLQISIAGAAAMAARAGEIAGPTAEGASASVAAHQIALQLWLLCSFVCDALAAASQALVADGLGRDDPEGVRNVSKTIFVYGLGLGLTLAAGLELGDLSGFLLNLFTQDAATQEALKPLLLILIAAQPLNSFVFAADGVLQGASEFSYQAKSMVLSASVAIASFVGFRFLYSSLDGIDTVLSQIWYSLVILQLMRGLTSLWKLVDAKGPIDLLDRRQT